MQAKQRIGFMNLYQMECVQDTVAVQPCNQAPIVWVDAEHPLFQLYTSGSTGVCAQACAGGWCRAWRACAV
eukprot:1162014-Pelagomonas_calceolata.AAC.11